jgi:predicted DNA-binding ribbon-helix-helix protein
MNSAQRAERSPFIDDHVDIANRLAMRSVTINGRRTTMRLEPSMWNALRRIAEDHRMTVNQLCSKIDSSRGEMSMTAALRSYIVSYLQQMPMDHANKVGEAQSIDAILDELGTAYTKGELLRVRIERGEDFLVKVAVHLSILERGQPTPLAEIYREWTRRREQLQYLPRITELSARLLRRTAQDTMLSVVDLAAGGGIAQPHQDPVMAWNIGGTSNRPHPLLRAAFQQDMLAVEQQAEALYQVNQIRLGGKEQIYKRLLLPLSDDGSDVTRVLVAAMQIGDDMRAAAG